MKSTSGSKKLIVLSHSERVENEAEAISSLFQMGLKNFHLRKPTWKDEEIEQFLEKIPEEFYENIVLHSHYSLVRKYGLKGIHITQKTKKTGIEEKFKGYHTSISTHSKDEVLLLDDSYDYAFISPVFNSISKETYKSGFSLDSLRNFFRENATNTEIIALGGINPDNIQLLQDIPFNGYAVLGYLWENFSLNADMNDLMKRFKILKEMIYE
mgnify:CR=1 FL=1